MDAPENVITMDNGYVLNKVDLVTEEEKIKMKERLVTINQFTIVIETE